ncbi:hypothetical protein, partial [Pseudomonas syringae group genomosp. 3]
ALDASLRKSDAIRAELANATTLDTQPRRRAEGYVSRGQGQLAFWSQKFKTRNFHLWRLPNVLTFTQWDHVY